MELTKVKAISIVNAKGQEFVLAGHLEAALASLNRSRHTGDGTRVSVEINQQFYLTANDKKRLIEALVALPDNDLNLYFETNENFISSK